MTPRPIAAAVGLLVAAAAQAVPAPPFYLMALQLDMEPSPELLAVTARIAAAETERRGAPMRRGFPEKFAVQLKPGTEPAEALGPLAAGYKPGDPGSLELDSAYAWGIRRSLSDWAGASAPSLVSEVFTTSQTSSVRLRRAPEGFHLTYSQGNNCFAGCTERSSSTFAFDHEGRPLGPVEPEEEGPDGERPGGAPAARVASGSAGIYGLPSAGTEASGDGR